MTCPEILGTSSLLQKNTPDLTDAELALVKKSDLLKKVEFPKIWTSKELLETDFPEPEWILPGLIPQGLTIIAGSPKMGKSWLALQIAGALSVGLPIFGQATKKSKVLYLSLEDTERRLKSRLEILEVLPDKNLQIVTKWTRGNQALTWLEAFILHQPDVKCIIIDTLAKIRSGVDGNNYDDSSQELSRYKEFADNLNTGIIMIHHTRKMQAEDFLHTVSQSVGLTGTADTVLTISRGRGSADGILKATGRDIEESELALSFNNGKWSLIGDAGEVQKTRERQAVFDLLRDSPDALSPGEISDALDKNIGAVKMLLRRMVAEGSIKLVSRGRYTLVTCYFSDYVTLENTDVPKSNIVTQSNESNIVTEVTPYIPLY